MKCLGCGVSCKDKTRMCWAKFQMCIRCAIENHPTQFPYAVIARYSEITTQKNISRFKVCEDCHNIMSRLRYWKNHTTVSLNTYYCISCKVIINFDGKIRYTHPLEIIK